MDSRVVTEHTLQNRRLARAIWINVNSKNKWRREDDNRIRKLYSSEHFICTRHSRMLCAAWHMRYLSLPGRDQDGSRATAVPRMSVAYPLGSHQTAPPLSLVTSYCRWLEGVTALLKLRVRPTILLTAWDLGHRSSSKLQRPVFPLDWKKETLFKRLKLKNFYFDRFLADFIIKLIVNQTITWIEHQCVCVHVISLRWFIAWFTIT